jgi:hypothetical protein
MADFSLPNSGVELADLIVRGYLCSIATWHSMSKAFSKGE